MVSYVNNHLETNCQNLFTSTKPINTQQWMFIIHVPKKGQMKGIGFPLRSLLVLT